MTKLEWCRQNAPALWKTLPTAELLKRMEPAWKNVKDSVQLVPEYRVQDLVELALNSSSKGNQRKWVTEDSKLFIKEQFKYQGKLWSDWKVECLGTLLSNQMNLPSNVSQQTPCKVEDNFGVQSKNFYLDGYSFVSFRRLINIDVIEYPYNGFIDTQFEFIVDTVNKLCSVDISEYLLSMLLLDVLVGNEDRHLNNFGVFSNNSTYVPAIIFDFGLGMFEHDRCYEKCESLEQAIEMMQCKPFNINPLSNLAWLQREHKEFLNTVLPKEFVVPMELIPSNLAFEYFDLICKELGVDVIYD